MNKATILGRLTKDPSINYSQTGTCVARFTMAVPRKYKKEEADFISCICFGKLGEIIEKYVKKGSLICVAGHIQTGSYTNREGNKVYTTDLVVEDMQMCDSKPKDKEEPKQMSLDDGFLTVPDTADSYLPFPV